MHVFISWSKEPSRTVAEALRDWLPDIIQNLEPWMSSADIGAGARWSTRVAEALASTKIGILCVTPDNQQEPWLLFEAGALAKTLNDTFVCPYLIQMRAADLTEGPLTQFQAKLADREGTFELLSTVNSALRAEALPMDRLRRLFDRSWPDLERKLAALPAAAPNIHRPQPEVLTEILETVRSMARRMPSSPTPASADRTLLEHFVEDKLGRLNPEVGRRLRQLPDEELFLLYTELRDPYVRGAACEWALQKLLSTTPPPGAGQPGEPPSP